MDKTKKEINRETLYDQSPFLQDYDYDYDSKVVRRQDFERRKKNKKNY